MCDILLPTLEDYVVAANQSSRPNIKAVEGPSGSIRVLGELLAAYFGEYGSILGISHDNLNEKKEKLLKLNEKFKTMHGNESFSLGVGPLHPLPHLP